MKFNFTMEMDLEENEVKVICETIEKCEQYDNKRNDYENERFEEQRKEIEEQKKEVEKQKKDLEVAQLMDKYEAALERERRHSEEICRRMKEREERRNSKVQFSEDNM